MFLFNIQIPTYSKNLYFQNETKKLLNFATTKELFPFKTVDDVLLENRKLKTVLEECENRFILESL